MARNAILALLLVGLAIRQTGAQISLGPWPSLPIPTSTQLVSALGDEGLV
jgi:hypothetical protein